jgi:hypothetical protein
MDFDSFQISSRQYGLNLHVGEDWCISQVSNWLFSLLILSYCHAGLKHVYDWTDYLRSIFITNLKEYEFYNPDMYQ